MASNKMLLFLCVWTYFLLASNFAHGNSITQYDFASPYITVPKYISNNQIEKSSDAEKYEKVSVRCSGGGGGPRRRRRPGFGGGGGGADGFSPSDQDMFYKQSIPVLSDFLSKLLPQNGTFSQYGTQNPLYPSSPQYPNNIQGNYPGYSNTQGTGLPVYENPGYNQPFGRPSQISQGNGPLGYNTQSNPQGPTGSQRPGYNMQPNTLGVPNSNTPGGSIPQGYYNAQPNSGYTQTPQRYGSSGYNTQLTPQGKPGSQRPGYNMQQNTSGAPISQIPGGSNMQMPQGYSTQPNSGYYTQTPQSYGTSGYNTQVTPQGKPGSQRPGYNTQQNSSGVPNSQYQGGSNTQTPQEYYDTPQNSGYDAQQTPQGIQSSQINSRPGSQQTNPGALNSHIPQRYESPPYSGNRLQNIPGTSGSQRPGNNPQQGYLSNSRPYPENLQQNSLTPNQEYVNSQNQPVYGSPLYSDVFQQNSHIPDEEYYQRPDYDIPPYSDGLQQDSSLYFDNLPQNTIGPNQGYYFNDQRPGYTSLPYPENMQNSARPNQGYLNSQLPYQDYQQGYFDSANNQQSVPISSSSLETQNPINQNPVSNPEYSITPNYQIASQQNQIPLANPANQVNPNHLSNQQADGLQIYSSPNQYDQEQIQADY